MFIFQIFLAIFSIPIIWFWWSRRWYRELGDKIPGRNGLPLIGVAHKFFAIEAYGEIVCILSD
jgi:hypothetical protein